MFIAYLDESGDDGYPQTSSRLFVQSAVYLHHRQWQEAFASTREFRRKLAQESKFPFDVELHTRELLLNKDPYHALGIPEAERLELLAAFCRHIATLELRIINVVIDKSAIKTPEYAVLDKAVTYLIQRIENDLKPTDDRFLLITDEGRVGMMRATARRVQRINFVPSKFGPEARRQEIRLMIEDPLPKRSHESYFIQFADLAACLTNLHMQVELGVATWPNRLARYARPQDIATLLELLKPRLNLKASAQHPLGIVCYPKK
ncbi:MAG: hypothetical protein RL376_980 [Verrucomicrobiota bacterium]